MCAVAVQSELSWSSLARLTVNVGSAWKSDESWHVDGTVTVQGNWVRRYVQDHHVHVHVVIMSCMLRFCAPPGTERRSAVS